MKLKGIWVAIAVICVAGIGITDYSARYLYSEPEIAADSEPEPLQGKTKASLQAAVPDEMGDAAGGTGISVGAEERQPEEKTGILGQLAELDVQAGDRRSASTDGSANAMKAAAESERKIWESKLQNILEILEQRLSGEEKTTFFSEQRSWVRERENAAVANSKKQSGSTLEELEYIRSLRDITRERVYELAEHYEAILDESE